jgi:hypothetical protein
LCGAPDAPEDQAICLFAGLLANPDMALSLQFLKFDQTFEFWIEDPGRTTSSCFSSSSFVNVLELVQDLNYFQDDRHADETHKMCSKRRLEATAPEKEIAKVRRLEGGKDKKGTGK